MTKEQRERFALFQEQFPLFTSKSLFSRANRSLFFRTQKTSKSLEKPMSEFPTLPTVQFTCLNNLIQVSRVLNKPNNTLIVVHCTVESFKGLQTSLYMSVESTTSQINPVRISRFLFIQRILYTYFSRLGP